ncbi:TetR/AcrR family transcriptional regulator [Nocardia vinacea]|uniref:TetR/AcrR family transcriptional regulator n=1 Tax=Nocardia vinacea TaxID=96468 RepID=A0ABZ1YRW8_9NOCA|nr:TetR family transcriptional regulator [Nocardia vinacea]
MGLRERKKRHTRAAISDAAIRLFLADGFDAVSVVDIAATAEVSKRTLFKYFPSKEDLVVHRFADHVARRPAWHGTGRADKRRWPRCASRSAPAWKITNQHRPVRRARGAGLLPVGARHPDTDRAARPVPR